MPPYCEEHQRYHLDGWECLEMRDRATAARRAARLREKAEEIALDALCHNFEPNAGSWGDIDSLTGALQNGDVTTEQVIAAMTAAALAALTEKENAS